MCFVSLGHVLHVQAGQTPTGVQDDDGDYKRWREPPDVFRIPTDGFKTSREDRRQSANIYHFQEDHTTDSKPLNTQSRHLNPVIPGIRRIKTSPDSRKIHQADFGSVFSSGVVHHAKTKLTGEFSSAQVEKDATGFGQNNKEAHSYSHSNAAGPDTQDIKLSPKPESSVFFINPSRRLPLHLQELHLSIRPEMFRYDPASSFPSSFNHERSNYMQEDLKPIKEKMKSVVTSGSNLAGKADTLMSRPTWRPRSYGGDAMLGAKGYAHVRHIKPRFDKTGPQASSAAGSKFLGDKPGGSRRHPPPDRAQTVVQGKFKPFQRLNINSDLPAHTPPSDRESAPPQTSAGTTLPPSLNSTGVTSSVVPSVTAEMSTRSAPPSQTEGQDAELIPQTSNHEEQSESEADVGPSLEQDKPLEVSPLKLKPADKEEKGDMVVSSPPENDHSEA